MAEAVLRDPFGRHRREQEIRDPYGPQRTVFESVVEQIDDCISD